MRPKSHRRRPPLRPSLRRRAFVLLPTLLVTAACRGPVPVEFDRGFERSSSFDAAVRDVEIVDPTGGATGALTFDVNGDGLVDVLLNVASGFNPQNVWLVRQSAPEVWEPATQIHRLNGVFAITDMDHDGFPDLIVGYPLSVATGGPRGVNVNEPRMLVDEQRNPFDALPTGITPMDLDRDGRTDLALAAFPGRDRVLYEEPDGTLRGVDLGEGLAFAHCPVDLGADALPALLTMLEGPYEADNLGGGFWMQPTAREWMQRLPDGWPEDEYTAPSIDAKGTPMACAWGDLDNDGQAELWLSQQTDRPVVYDRNPDGEWRRVEGSLRGLVGYPRSEQDFEVHWGAVITDFDGDGYDDLAVAGGNDFGFSQGFSPGAQSHVAVYVQRELGFGEAGARIGLHETGDFFTLVTDDTDGDGRPDLLVGGFREERPRLYLNRLAPHGNMLALEPRGRGADAVRIDVAGTERSWTWTAGRQAQPMAFQRPVLFRGVGDEELLDVTVHWPGGPQGLELTPRDEPWILESP